MRTKAILIGYLRVVPCRDSCNRRARTNAGKFRPAERGGDCEAAGFVSLEPVPRGKAFQVAVVAEIRNGYHINANKPADEFLIPTTLTAQLPSRLAQVETVYPPQQSLKFSFSQTPLPGLHRTRADFSAIGGRERRAARRDDDSGGLALPGLQ